MDKDFSFEAFAAHAREVSVRFERRRMEFLRRLKTRCAIAALLLVTFPIWFSLLEDADNLSAHPLSNFSWVLVHVIAGAVILILIVAWGVMPLFRYRHYTAQIGSALPGVSGPMQQDVSLKGEIFGQLFRYFGDFNLYNDRKLSLKLFRNAPDMPEFDECVSEDFIEGNLSGVVVAMTEATLLVHRQRAKLPIFSGLVIVLDIDNTRVALRGRFDGKTVLIADRALRRDYIAAKYAGYRHVAPADTSFAQRFEALTTDAAEAERLLSADLLRNLLKLSDAVQNAKNQVRHIDDKLAYAIANVASGASDMMSFAATGLFNWFRTGHFSRASTRPGLQQVETHVTPDARGLNESVHCAFYDDKILITIPSHQNLFEPDLIFRPPLHEDDIRLVYDLMTTIAGIAGAVVGTLRREMV